MKAVNIIYTFFFEYFFKTRLLNPNHDSVQTHVSLKKPNIHINIQYTFDTIIAKKRCFYWFIRTDNTENHNLRKRITTVADFQTTNETVGTKMKKLLF